MSDDENHGYGRRKSAPVPSMSISPMEEVERKREPKSSYKIPKKSPTSVSKTSSRDFGQSGGFSRDRDRSSYRQHDRYRDRGHDAGHKRRESFGDSRSPLSRRDSRESKLGGGFRDKMSGYLEAELSFAENDASWKDLIDDNAPPPDLSWKPVERKGESGFPGAIHYYCICVRVYLSLQLKVEELI